MTCAQFVLQKLDLSFAGRLPELAIEIAAAPRVAGVVLEAGRIADRIRFQVKGLRQARVRCQKHKKFSKSQRASRFIAVNGGEQTDANGIAAIGSLKRETRQRIRFARHIEGSEEIRAHTGQFEERRKELLDRAAAV